MEPDKITIPVRLDAGTFRRFALFDALSVKKSWIRPTLFCLILFGFAFLALLLKKGQSGLVAAVLLTVGVGLPTVWIGMFFSQINVQAEKNRLSPARKVYTVTLEQAGLTVQNHQRAGETLRLPWSDAWKVYRRKDCMYLYISRQKAFLLPAGQADAPDDALYAYLIRRISPDKENACPPCSA